MSNVYNVYSCVPCSMVFIGALGFMVPVIGAGAGVLIVLVIVVLLCVLCAIMWYACVMSNYDMYCDLFEFGFARDSVLGRLREAGYSGGWLTHDEFVDAGYLDSYYSLSNDLDRLAPLLYPRLKRFDKGTIIYPLLTVLVNVDDGLFMVRISGKRVGTVEWLSLDELIDSCHRYVYAGPLNYRELLLALTGLFEVSVVESEKVQYSLFDLKAFECSSTRDPFWERGVLGGLIGVVAGLGWVDRDPVRRLPYRVAWEELVLEHPALESATFRDVQPSGFVPNNDGVYNVDACSTVDMVDA